MSEISHLPSHVGIIMDGNGRWAQSRGLPRTAGHREGLEAAKRIVKAAADLELTYLTLYVFSTENWKRAQDEVSFLMRLIQQHLRKEYDFYRENGIRVVHSGDFDGLPGFVQKEIVSVIEDTRDFDGLTVNLAINYGGRDEVTRSVNRWLREQIDIIGQDNPISSIPALTPEDISANIDDACYPDMDLIIRTGGEKRLSNFLLWQSAYAELYFTDTYWPDWHAEHLIEAVESFGKRERRYGGMSRC